MRRFSCLLAVAALALLQAGVVLADVLPFRATVDKLGNGLTVVTVPWRSPGIVAYFSLVRVGSRDEVEKGHTGFAHLFEHLMFRGTVRYPQKIYEDKIQEFGADNSGSTSLDYTAYNIVAPSEVLPEIIDIDADRFQNLDYSEAAFKTETGAVLGEYGMASSHPSLKMWEAMLAQAFKQHTYGHTTLGNLADIKAMPSYYAYSKQFHKWYYTPDNITLIVVGDFDRAAVLAKIEAAFGKWKGKRRNNAVKAEPEQKEPRSAHLDWEAPTPPRMLIGFKTPLFAPDKESAALAVIAELAFGSSSPLYKKLVIDERKLLNLDVDGGLFTAINRDPTLLLLSAELREGTAFDEVQEAVTKTLADIADGKVPAERVEAAKAHAKYLFVLEHQTPRDVAWSLVRAISATSDPGSLEAYASALGNVSAQDVARVAKTYLTPKRRTVVTLSAKGGAK